MQTIAGILLPNRFSFSSTFPRFQTRDRISSAHRQVNVVPRFVVACREDEGDHTEVSMDTDNGQQRDLGPGMRYLDPGKSEPTASDMCQIVWAIYWALLPECERCT